MASASFFTHGSLGRWDDILNYYRHPTQEHDQTNNLNHDRSIAYENNLTSLYNDLQDIQPQTKLVTSSPPKYRHSLDRKNEDNRIANEVRHQLSEMKIHERSFGSTPTPPPSPEPHHHSLFHRLTHKLTFKEQLLDKALNIKNLTIGQNQRVIIDPFDRLYLPALKTISWHADSICDSQTCRQCNYEYGDNLVKKIEINNKRRNALYRILRAAPNLKLIKDFNFDMDFDLVISTGKVECIENLTIGYDTVNVDHLLEFVEARPHVKTLQLYDSGQGFDLLDFERRQKLALVVKFLILTTYDTLKILDLGQFCTYFDLQIPHLLSKLQQLTIGNIPTVGYKSPSRVFPVGINLNKIFPNLTILDCSRLHCDENDYWNFYFPVGDPFVGCFEGVKVLVISDQTTHFFMEKIRKELCPNFDKLVVTSRGHDNSLNFMMVKIFQWWRHLQALEIRIRDFPTIHSFSLDPTLTGLSEETCERLRSNGVEDDDVDDDVDEIQASHSKIADLSHLKTLELVLGHDCLAKFAQGEGEELAPLMSFVSDRYGFSHLPQLQVVITFDQECPWGKELATKLEPLTSPWINLKHKHDPCCCRPTAA